MKLRSVRAVVTALIAMPALGIALFAGSAGRSGPRPGTEARPATRKFSFS